MSEFGTPIDVVTTPLQARGVLYLQAQAKDMGMTIEFEVGAIIIKASSKPKFRRLVPDAVLGRGFTVETARAWLTGFAAGWSYGNFCSPEKKPKRGAKKR